MMSLLGITPSDFYVGGDEAGRVQVLPRDGECAFVVGVGVTAPLTSSRRHQVALQLAGVKLSSLPLLHRSSAQAARLMFAAFAATDCPLPSGVLREELGDQPRALGKQLPRRVRKVIPELARALPDGGSRMERHCRLLVRHTHRLALLLSGDLYAATEAILGALPARDAISESDDALDLIRAWVSSPMATLRTKVGLVR
jgi:hypothetical protein